MTPTSQPRVERPQPPPDQAYEREAPEGFRLEWVKDDDWVVATSEDRHEKKCRRFGCKRAPVAALLRPIYGPPGRRRSRWFYCDWHLYGRRFHDGRVETLRAVPEAKP